jgi:hypothetical protein
VWLVGLVAACVEDVPDGLTVVPAAFDPDAPLWRAEHFLSDRRPGLALADVDDDGDVDAFLADSGQLYLNDGDLGLQLAPAALPGGAQAAAFGDVDGDGDPDLVVAGAGFVRVFENSGARWIDRGLLPDGARGGVATTVVVADLTADGIEDVLVARMAQPPVPLSLFVGEGAFEFTADVWALPQGEKLSWTAMVADLDADGYLDIYWPDDALIGGVRERVGDTILRNVGPDAGGRARFEDVGAVAGVASRRSTMGIAVADFNQDGAPDLFTSDYHFSTVWWNDPLDPSFGRWTPENVSLGREQIGWGVRADDFDHDGSVDVAVVHGNLIGGRGDATNRLLLDAGGSLDVRPLAAGAAEATRDDRSLAGADLDGDGDQDLLVIPLEGTYRVLRNDLAAGRYLRICLIGALRGRDAVGAVVTVSQGDRRWRRWVYRGGSPYAESDAVVHVGLADDASPVHVHVRWPSRLEQELRDVAVDRTIAIEEPRIIDLPVRAFRADGRRIAIGRVCRDPASRLPVLTTRAPYALERGDEESGCVTYTTTAPTSATRIALDAVLDGRLLAVHPVLVFEP